MAQVPAINPQSALASWDLEPFSPVIGSRALDAITLGRLLVGGQHIAHRIRYGGDQGVVVLGPNGKGKGTRLLIPNLLQSAGCSMVVIDPKGELAAVTAPFRRALGRVVVINPFGVLTDIPGYEDLQSTGFNPLAGLDPDAATFNSDVALIAQALVAIEGKDPHWSQSARALIAFLVMHVVLEAKRLGIVPTMRRVRELLCQPSDGPHEGNDFVGVGIPKLAADALASNIPGLANKAAQFTEWTNEVRSIVSTAKIQTEPFDDPHIAADMAKSGFDFRDLKNEPVTVHLVLPPQMMERHSKWLRLVVTTALLAVLKPRRPGQPKTLFLLDEFYALGHLEIISTVWSLVRGYGVQLMPVLQSLGQLKHLYPDMWETFVGMAGAVVSFGPNDLTTAEWLSKRAGETTRSIITTSDSVSEGSNWGSNSGGSSNQQGGSTSFGSSEGGSFGSSSSVNRSQIRAPLITAHKLFGLAAGQMVITLDGLSHLIPAYAPAYYDIRRCWLVARDNPYYWAGHHG